MPNSLTLIESEIDKLLQIQSYIDNNLSKDLSIKELTAAFGISSPTLRRHFALYFGKSIGKYILDKRMETAMIMLSQRKMNISQVSEYVGYKYHPVFTRSFTRYFGHSPAHYYLRKEGQE